jgi:hypothetical protein
MKCVAVVDVVDDETVAHLFEDLLEYEGKLIDFDVCPGESTVKIVVLFEGRSSASDFIRVVRPQSDLEYITTAIKEI